MSKFLEFFGFVSQEKAEDEVSVEEKVQGSGEWETPSYRDPAPGYEQETALDYERSAARDTEEEVASTDAYIDREVAPPTQRSKESYTFDVSRTEAAQTEEAVAFRIEDVSVDPQTEATERAPDAPVFTYKPMKKNSDAEDYAQRETERPKKAFAFVPPTADEPIEAPKAVEAEAPPVAAESAEPVASVETSPAEGAFTETPPAEAAPAYTPHEAPVPEAIPEQPIYTPYEAPVREAAPEQPAYTPYEAPAREEVPEAAPEQPTYTPYEEPVREESLEALPETPAYEAVAQAEAVPDPAIQETFISPVASEPTTQEEYIPRTTSAASEEGEIGSGDVTAYTGTTADEPEEEKPRSLSVISEDAYIDGDVTTSGNIEVQGGISGNVRAKGAVDVRGAIRGSVSGEKLGLYGCTVQGDMRATTGILIDAESMVIGDVKTKNIYLDGKLKGNIESEDVSLLRSNAYYVGDIVTGSIAIEGGATISGNIRTLIEGDVEDPFRPDSMPDMAS
jgi:cytoskeletal protein CcmA (bactofilin family)